MVSAVAFAVCLCRPDVHNFITVISFYANMEDALLNKLDLFHFIPWGT